jgi:hypothetical protein
MAAICRLCMAPASGEVSVPPSTFWQDIASLREMKGTEDMHFLVSRERNYFVTCADITFLLEDGGTLRAHRVILACSSPYFEAMLMGFLKESNNTSIRLPLSTNACEVLLKYLYSPFTKFDLDLPTAVELFQEASLMLLPALRARCEREIESKAKLGELCCLRLLLSLSSHSLSLCVCVCVGLCVCVFVCRNLSLRL